MPKGLSNGMEPGGETSDALGADHRHSDKTRCLCSRSAAKQFPKTGISLLRTQNSLEPSQGRKETKSQTYKDPC